MEKDTKAFWDSIGSLDAVRMAEEAAAWRDLIASTRQLRAYRCPELEKEFKGEPVKIVSTKPDPIDEKPYHAHYRDIRASGEPLGYMRRATNWIAPKKKNDVTIEVVERKKDVI